MKEYALTINLKDDPDLSATRMSSSCEGVTVAN